ncbi:MAG TPA: 23S rRNA (adenine(2503)-C(2))-methyltransferase RlmN [Candidatus Anaerotignum merdipullorum]|nr:23S rRNA (adenine(2503)-C(2))-methyltransferase RlmN [Candidatus Anaerotignum merdipullorum]
MGKTDVASMDLAELQVFFDTLGEPKFRAKQLFEWLHQKQVDTFAKMTNLPQKLREKLEEEATIGGVQMVEKLVSRVDGTRKYLFALENGSVIESVLMQYDYGNTVCVSTQAGCRMGCQFCASTLDGVERSLTAGEMLAQVYTIQKDLGQRISGVVLMGSGEPLDNYDAVLRFIRLLNDANGQNMGQRHMTLSTCGLIAQIYRLAKEQLQITLAVSLHAPNDEIRRQIMPVARANPMEELLQACVDYAAQTKRRITYEYAMMQGINDSDDCARELAKRLRHTLCHVNLIPMNPVKERAYTKSSDQRVQRFAHLLQQDGVETTIRRRLGSDIDAACGQLRRRYMQK